MTDPLQYQLTGSLAIPVDTIVIPTGVRGPEGPDGPQGPQGDQGESIAILGAWDPGTAYTGNQAVSYRSSASVALQSLWVVRSGQTTTIGVPPTDEAAKYVEIGATNSPTIFGSQFQVIQGSHPFTAIGQPVAFYPSTGKYELADTRQYSRLGFGLVMDIADANTFTVQTAGKISGLEAGAVEGGSWDDGTVHFVSTTPGLLTTTPGMTAGYRSMPLLVPTGLEGGLQSGVILGWGPTGFASVMRSESPPVGAEPGNLWYRTSLYPGLYVLMETGSGNQWVQTNG